jgi:adenylate kinase family enzyme
VIVGNGGGGKSTLARVLAGRHHLQLCSVDRIQWNPGWEPASEAVVSEYLRSVMAGDRWVIDGWGPWPTIETRMALSDTIVFVDLPLWMHFWLAAERQIAVAKGGSRIDPVNGCDDLTITRRLFETIWRVDLELIPRLTRLIDQYAPERDYHHITTLEQLNALATAG